MQVTTKALTASLMLGLLTLALVGQTEAAAPYEPMERYWAIVRFRVGQATVLSTMAEKAWQRDKITAVHYEAMKTWWRLIDIASSLVAELEQARMICGSQMAVVRDAPPGTCGSSGHLSLYE